MLCKEASTNARADTICRNLTQRPFIFKNTTLVRWNQHGSVDSLNRTKAIRLTERLISNLHQTAVPRHSILKLSFNKLSCTTYFFIRQSLRNPLSFHTSVYFVRDKPIYPAKGQKSVLCCSYTFTRGGYSKPETDGVSRAPERLRTPWDPGCVRLR